MIIYYNIQLESKALLLYFYFVIIKHGCCRPFTYYYIPAASTALAQVPIMAPSLPPHLHSKQTLTVGTSIRTPLSTRPPCTPYIPTPCTHNMLRTNTCLANHPIPPLVTPVASLRQCLLLPQTSDPLVRTRPLFLNDAHLYGHGSVVRI